MNGDAKPPVRGADGLLYAAGLSPEQLADYNRALSIEGLDEEIALLRLRLRETLNDKDAAPRVVTQVMNALVRAVATQHRISPGARKDLADNIAAVLNSLGDQLLPADRV